MTAKKFFMIFVAALCLSAPGRAAKPNILFIMLDDLGKEWVSCYGASDIETPEIDKLAASGTRYNNFYVMPQCTPTRTTLMTGQYPFRHGWVNHWDVPRWGGGCHFDASRNPSIGRVMKTAGYRTAVAGKWQINDFRVQADAMVKHGFDDYCMWTGYESGVKASSKRYWDPYIHTKTGSRTYEGKYGEDVFADFLIGFMKENLEKPMFLYYPVCLPHGPFVTTPNDKKAQSNLEKHKAMVRYADFTIGRLVNALEELGLRKNTIVIVSTDNGSTGSVTGTLKGRRVRGGKAKTTENGVNMPFIVNAPGLVPEGKVSDTLIDITDMFPTFAALGGASLPKDYIFDGVSFADALLGKTDRGPRKWIMAMGGRNEAARTDGGIENKWYFRDRVIRNERYKLFVSTDRKPVKLVDLQEDPAEKNNLIDNAEHAETVKMLFAVIEKQPEKDNDPIYGALKSEAWDVKIKAKSQVWKSGRPAAP